MQRELGELDLQTVILFQFLDTPGDEVAPRSNEIGEYFENEGFGHSSSFVRFIAFKSFKTFKSFKPSRHSRTHAGARASDAPTGVEYYCCGGAQVKDQSWPVKLS
jgi:hypothetical protein